MKTVDRTMSEQQQVTDEGTRSGKSHNGASESELNLTLPDRRRGERRENMQGTKSSEGENETGLY